jgi:hypothetical protein
MTTHRDEVLAHAFSELGRACALVAAALRLRPGDGEARASRAEAPPRVKPEAKTRAPKQKKQGGV